jgi:nitrate reductase NapE component
MKREKISEAMGNISSRHIKEAAEFKAEEKPHRNKTHWVKWASLAACLCLVVGVALRIAIGFLPNQATDVFREGTLIEITSESDLPAQYD